MAETQFDYREYYEQYYNVKIPTDFDIHHIDGNRKNNDIYNLLMLPHKLHNKYHYCLLEYIKIQHNRVFDGQLKWNNQYIFLVINEFGKVLEECQKWITYKAQLDQIKQANMIRKSWDI